MMKMTGKAEMENNETVLFESRDGVESFHLNRYAVNRERIRQLGRWGYGLLFGD